MFCLCKAYVAWYHPSLKQLLVPVLSCFALCSSLLFSALVPILALDLNCFGFDPLMGSVFLYVALRANVCGFEFLWCNWLLVNGGTLQNFNQLRKIPNLYVVGYVGMRTHQYIIKALAPDLLKQTTTYVIKIWNNLVQVSFWINLKIPCTKCSCTGLLQLLIVFNRLLFFR